MQTAALFPLVPSLIGEIMSEYPRWAFFLLLFFMVGQVLHWMQLHAVAKKAGAAIQLPFKSTG